MRQQPTGRTNLRPRREVNKQAQEGRTRARSTLTLRSGVSHLQEERDPGGFAAAASDRLQEPAAGHHLPADGVHAGPGQRLLEHGLHGQRAQTSLRPESSIKQVRTLMSRGASAELTRRLRVICTGGAGGVVFYHSD